MAAERQRDNAIRVRDPQPLALSCLGLAAETGGLLPALLIVDFIDEERQRTGKRGVIPWGAYEMLYAFAQTGLKDTQFVMRQKESANAA